MQAMVRFQLSSLRGKLGAAAFAGLITTAVLTGLLLMTAWTASDVVNTATHAHERARIYSQLYAASREYQGASYGSVRDPGHKSWVAVAISRSKFERLLVDVSQLPVTNAHDRRVAKIVAEQGRIVLERFRNTDQLVQRVDRVWHESGSKAALEAVRQISAPATVLQDTLQEEIDRGDGAVTEASSRALSMIRIAVAASFVGLVLALGFSLVVQALLHTRLRPGLSRLAKGAKAFGAGELGHRIGLGGSDELSQLAAAFDAMAETIAEKQGALREVQLGLERAVAERTEELQRANAKLSAADERRRDFLADVSHELRTPLTVIRGETQVALRTADEPGFDAHDVFERILQQTLDLSRMVDDLFLIARAEAGGLPLERQMLDLKRVAARVAGDFATVANEAGGSIGTAGEAGIVAFVDPCRLRRALAALIENALRHCHPGVNIEIEVRTVGASALVAVSDDGPGIDPELAQQLFQRFRRGETRGEGSGLGLSLVNALVEAHGGRAYLEQRPCGGTRAVMQFPLSEAAQEAA